MAMIKCPECGHIISDKAPFCPSCGVEIAGRVMKCPECGNEYFSDQPECPYCHHLTPKPSTETPKPAQPTSRPIIAQTSKDITVKQQPEQTVAGFNAGNVPPQTPPHNVTYGTNETNVSQPKKKNYTLIAIVIAAAIIACGAIFYFVYQNASNSKEEDAYEYAMNSDDPNVLQSYLDTYTDAPEAHRDSIQAHLQLLNQADQEWTNALVSGSKSALQDYLNNHPDSPFKSIALHKIDSIDWDAASTANTVEAYESYIEDHPNGEYIDEANNSIKGLNTKTVQPEEKQMISSLFNSFFMSLNNKDADALSATVNPLLTSFLGKRDATRSDVVTFMNKIYKSDIEKMNWQSASDYTISKKEIGDQQYEYTVTFSATEAVTKTDATTSENNYRIKAKVNPDGRITEFNMNKILK